MNIEQCKTNMSEKLKCMKRSISRMRAAGAAKIDYQDHFLCYIHTSRLIWFYLGRYIESNKNIRIKAADMVDTWKANCLSETEVEVWEKIRYLRTEDVHFQPVYPATQSDYVTYNGEVLTYDGEAVTVDDEKIDIDQLCDDGIKLFERFIKEFSQYIV